MTPITAEELAFIMTRAFVLHIDMPSTLSIIQAVLMADVCCLAQLDEPLLREDPLVHDQYTPMHRSFAETHALGERKWVEIGFDKDYSEKTVSSKMTVAQRLLVRSCTRIVLNIDNPGSLRGKLLRIPAINQLGFGAEIDKQAVADYMKARSEPNELAEIFLRA